MAVGLPVRPSTKLGWWAFGLGVTALLWGLFAPSVPMMLRPLLESAGGMRLPISVGMTTVGLAVLLAIAAIWVGVTALVKRERSWLGIAGLVLAGLSGGFWAVFALGEVLLPH